MRHVKRDREEWIENKHNEMWTEIDENLSFEIPDNLIDEELWNQAAEAYQSMMEEWGDMQYEEMKDKRMGL